MRSRAAATLAPLALACGCTVALDWTAAAPPRGDAALTADASAPSPDVADAPADLPPPDAARPDAPTPPPDVPPTCVPGCRGGQVCCGGACRECCGDSDCHGNGRRCCAGRCRECCSASDCTSGRERSCCGGQCEERCM